MLYAMLRLPYGKLICCWGETGCVIILWTKHQNSKECAEVGAGAPLSLCMESVL